MYDWIPSPYKMHIHAVMINAFVKWTFKCTTLSKNMDLTSQLTVSRNKLPLNLMFQIHLLCWKNSEKNNFDKTRFNGLWSLTYLILVFSLCSMVDI